MRRVLRAGVRGASISLKAKEENDPSPAAPAAIPLRDADSADRRVKFGSARRLKPRGVSVAPGAFAVVTGRRAAVDRGRRQWRGGPTPRGRRDSTGSRGRVPPPSGRRG